jgi:predicted acetyltransferase
MASKIITDLNAYTTAEVQSTDLLYITDLTHQETKKITAGDFGAYTVSTLGINKNGSNFTFSGSVSGSSFTSSVVNEVGFLGTSSWSVNSRSSSYAKTSSYALNSLSVTAESVGVGGGSVVANGNGPNLTFKNITGTGGVTVSEDVESNNIIVTLSGISGSTVSPGGSQYSVQYHDPVGLFNGKSSFTFQPDSVTGTVSLLTLSGSISASSFTSSVVNEVGFLGTSSYATNARSASNARTSSYSFSSSNAASASYSLTASYAVYAQTANATTTYGVTSAQSFNIKDPLGSITYGDYHYIASYKGLGSQWYCQIIRQDQVNHDIEFVYDRYPSDLAIGGFFSIQKYDDAKGLGGNIDRIVYGDASGFINVLSNISSTPTAISRSIGAAWQGLRCVYVNTTANQNDNNATTTNPTFYMMASRVNRGTLSGMQMYKIYYNGTTYTYQALHNSYPMNLIGSAAQANITNWAAFYKLEAYKNQYIFSTNYNPIKKRLYLITSGCGACHVFNINGYNSANIGEWFQQPDATRFSQLNYEKAVVIQSYKDFTYDNDWDPQFSLEYDTTTGDEKYWSYITRGNGEVQLGIVGKSPCVGLT